MPHGRSRYASQRIQEILRYSPIVGVLGQRQVGKTTLLEQASAGYVSLDREKVLFQADSDPELFLQNRASPFGIDEAQLSAGLFPALKEHVRTHKAPGQFLLSGSVRFTSKKAIRESLTGRIVSTEVLPFTISEAHEAPLPDTCLRLLKAERQADLRFLERRSYSSRKAFESYLSSGGLPGICFFRDSHVRTDKFEAHLDTLLNRDIRQVHPTTLLYSSLRGLLEYLAKGQGRPFELKEASRASQISTITLKKILFALEALFLIRVVPAQGEKKSTFFLEDQGMATWLKGAALREPGDLVRGLYANLRQELHYRPETNGKIFQWRTKNDVDVPLVFSSTFGTLGIVPTIERTPAPKTLGSAQSFLKRFPGAKVVIAYDNDEIVCRTPSMFWIPYWLL